MSQSGKPCVLWRSIFPLESLFTEYFSRSFGFYFSDGFIFFLVGLIKRKVFDRQPFPLEDLRKLIHLSGSYFRTFIPFILVPIATYQLLIKISFQLRFSALDPMFFNWDEKIFGGQAFLFLPSFFTDPVFTRLFPGAYASLPIAISLTMITLYIKSPNNLFRKMIVAYIVSILIGMPFFYAFPCQDPNNYFIRNIRNYSFSSEVSTRISQYAPNDLTRESIKKIFNSETNNGRADNTVPVNCFPSMHATWSLLVVFFMALVWRPTLFLTVPWAIFLLTGGLYLAQHYAVDYLAAIPVIAASILLGKILIKPEKVPAVPDA